MTIKILKNNFDYEEQFEDLEEAKKYYMPKEDVICDVEDYLGEDFDSYCEAFNSYKEEISNADSLEELAETLNRYSDIFGDGRYYSVREI